MSKQPLTFSLHPTMIAMLERVLQYPDRTKLTRNQIAEIIPMRDALRQARVKLNLMARGDLVLQGERFFLYTHPDRRDDGALMVYDRQDEDLHINTPFSGIPSEMDIISWLDSAS